MLISWENAGLPGSLASILQKGKTDEKCHQSYSFFTSKRAKEATVPSGPFFYNQILDMIADLEATRANREENISEKKIPVWHSNNLLYVECRYMKSIDVEAWQLTTNMHSSTLLFAMLCWLLQQPNYSSYWTWHLSSRRRVVYGILFTSSSHPIH